MQTKTEILFSNQWDVRISDPGLEGAMSHYFETVYLNLVAHIDGEKVSYEFTRKVEKEVQTHCIFHQIDELFKFLADYLGPVALGNIGVKIGKLGLA
ncbi:dithiol-disulfide isomerase [Muribacter muris]|uniref:Dithiol-disulfide isomerase n=1 Tax=Muribacter muris TaxID=67855 RepID=A0A4Y9JW32_9PAST|nr:DUF5377 domain-containing protein [Muribacter muris]MBF0785227.1 DUF5377 domain-containing protein [Muribacter muris]MBF0828411.1 DUF5377 domain-containing protein [Muribacter muris]TFV10054.1 dithiol-disulfide isomerase [Muribacter muris]